VIETWRRHYNEIWPHFSLGYLTPPRFIVKEIAASMHATGGALRYVRLAPTSCTTSVAAGDRSLN
jgi:hypothetical protein